MPLFLLADMKNAQAFLCIFYIALLSWLIRSII